MFDRLVDYLADMNPLYFLILVAGFLVCGSLASWYIVALVLWLGSLT